MARSIEQQLGRSLQGVLVAEVLPNSPAEKAGLQASTLRGDGTLMLGDLITDVDDQPVRQVEDLLSAIEEKKEGQVCTLTIQRACSPERIERIQAKLASRDSMKQQQRRDPVSPTSARNGYRFGIPNAQRTSGSAWQ
jgi:S1-C subfamily serine protease